MAQWYHCGDGLEKCREKQAGSRARARKNRLFFYFHFTLTTSETTLFIIYSICIDEKKLEYLYLDGQDHSRRSHRSITPLRNNRANA